MKTYRPIGCDLHDLLEIHTTRRELVDIVVLDPLGRECHLRAVISDIYSRNGEEFLKAHTEQEIRLDRLKSVGTILFFRDEHRKAVPRQAS